MLYYVPPAAVNAKLVIASGNITGAGAPPQQDRSIAPTRQDNTPCNIFTFTFYHTDYHYHSP